VLKADFQDVAVTGSSLRKAVVQNSQITALEPPVAEHMVAAGQTTATPELSVATGRLSTWSTEVLL
jgi:hypothetical protein